MSVGAVVLCVSIAGVGQLLCVSVGAVVTCVLLACFSVGKLCCV